MMWCLGVGLTPKNLQGMAVPRLALEKLEKRRKNTSETACLLESGEANSTRRNNGQKKSEEVTEEQISAAEHERLKRVLLWSTVSNVAIYGGWAVVFFIAGYCNGDEFLGKKADPQNYYMLLPANLED